jgi:hypothetical protein
VCVNERCFEAGRGFDGLELEIMFGGGSKPSAFHSHANINSSPLGE